MMCAGEFFLNLAFALYLVLYIPQILHNAKLQKFDHMSHGMHLMIFQAYACDLCYGLAKHLPWQYLCVSCIGLLFIWIQHIQWYQFKQRYQAKKANTFFFIGLIISVWPFLIFYCLEPNSQLLINGWVSRIFFTAHFLPQIIKNLQDQSDALVINVYYLALSISLGLLDLLAAFYLHWGLINLVGCIFGLLLKSILSLQLLHAKSKLFFLNTRSAR